LPPVPRAERAIAIKHAMSVVEVVLIHTRVGRQGYGHVGPIIQVCETMSKYTGDVGIAACACCLFANAERMLRSCVLRAETTGQLRGHMVDVAFSVRGFLEFSLAAYIISDT
jgi:hypothetical protein